MTRALVPIDDDADLVEVEPDELEPGDDPLELSESALGAEPVELDLDPEYDEQGRNGEGWDRL